MSLTEFDQEEYDRILRRDAFLDGKDEGLLIGKQEDARNMLARNFPVTDIAEITGLSVEDIQALKAEPVTV